MNIWIARDRNGELWIYSNKPRLDSITGVWFAYPNLNLPFDKFREVTFDNSPVKVELKLIFKSDEI